MVKGKKIRAIPCCFFIFASFPFISSQCLCLLRRRDVFCLMSVLSLITETFKHRIFYSCQEVVDIGLASIYGDINNYITTVCTISQWTYQNKKQKINVCNEFHPTGPKVIFSGCTVRSHFFLSSLMYLDGSGISITIYSKEDRMRVQTWQAFIRVCTCKQTKFESSASLKHDMHDHSMIWIIQKVQKCSKQ